MADTFGALELPAQVPIAGEAGGDPGLSRLAQYLKSILNANLTRAWRATSDPVQVPVNSVFVHDPMMCSFNTNDLPALFLYRDSEPSYQRLADDLDLDYTKLKALWVRIPTRQEFTRERDPFYNAIARAMSDAVERVRHPSYIMAGDTDPLAPIYGTNVLKVAGIYGLIWKGYKREEIEIEVDGDNHSTFRTPAFAGEIELIEQRILDISLLASTSSASTTNPDGTTGKGLDLTVTTPDMARDLSVAKT